MKIEIPMDTLYELIDNLSAEERKKLLEKLKAKPVKLRPFKKDKINSILTDFAATDLYEDEFLEDLKEGLKKSSIYLYVKTPVIAELRNDIKKYIR